MGHLRKITTLLRKVLLLGWAFAVIWIYIGNLINFHQHHIWGKQLMPVECSSTRVKEKDAASFVKNDRNSRSIDSGSQFDFTTPDQPASLVVHFREVTFYPGIPDSPALHQEIQAFSFRGPPSA